MLFKKFATAKFILPVNSADYVSSVRYRYDLISSFSSWVLTRIPARAVDANVMGIWIEVYGSSCSHRLRYCECNFDRLKNLSLRLIMKIINVTTEFHLTVDNWNMLSITSFPKDARNVRNYMIKVFIFLPLTCSFAHVQKIWKVYIICYLIKLS